VMHRSVVGLCTTTPVPRVPPKVTLIGAAKSVPVMVTVVPPAAGPRLGLTSVMTGVAPAAAAGGAR